MVIWLLWDAHMKWIHFKMVNVIQVKDLQVIVIWISLSFAYIFFLILRIFRCFLGLVLYKGSFMMHTISSIFTIFVWFLGFFMVFTLCLHVDPIFGIHLFRFLTTPPTHSLGIHSLHPRLTPSTKIFFFHRFPSITELNTNKMHCQVRVCQLSDYIIHIHLFDIVSRCHTIAHAIYIHKNTKHSQSAKQTMCTWKLHICKTVKSMTSVSCNSRSIRLISFDFCYFAQFWRIKCLGQGQRGTEIEIK